jgi:hypothetical protein
MSVSAIVNDQETIGSEDLPSSDALPVPQELAGLRRIRFWQRVLQIWLLAFVVLWPLTIVRYGTRWGFGLGIGNGNINLPIILGAIFWVAVSALIWTRLGALRCPRCGRSFYRIEPDAELLTGYRRHFQPFHSACDYCGLSTANLRILRGR